MDMTPTILATVTLPQGRVEMLEWQWPDIFDFQTATDELMLEMSLPPFATDSSAAFPDLDPDNRCFVGTLFVRFPHVMIHGRGEGGRIRVLRLVFDEGLARGMLGENTAPSVDMLKGLLDIRSDSLRRVMGLILREIGTQDERSPEALTAMLTLAAIELQRIFERAHQATNSGRLAAWQYRKIRARLAQADQPPTVTELASLCGISARHLNRQFQALTGSTVADYVTHYWIERAKTMLAQGDMPIKNIAFALGFSHANSFARTFRRATGLAPQSYRQHMAAATERQGAAPEEPPLSA